MFRHSWQPYPLLSALVLCLAACGSSDPEDTSPTCDEAACEVEGKTCDYIRNICVECLDNLDCSGKPATPRCDTATNTCVECTDVLHCASGDECVNNACVTPIECDEENPCPSDGICGEDAKCLTEQEVDCADLDAGEIPANASQKEGKVEITWTAENGWTAAAKCEWQCNPGTVVNDAGTGCEIPVTTTCETDSDCTDQGCVEGTCASEKKVACDDETTPVKPTDAIATNAEVTVTWNAEADPQGWTAAAKCEWGCPTDKPELDETANACVAAATGPVCGDGKIEGTEKCDTGADLSPAAPAFPENATCTSAMNDGKTYEGELACSADCSAIVTTGCTAAVPPVSCTAGACRLSTSGETTVTEICNAEGNAWAVDSCPTNTTCEVAENATEGTCACAVNTCSGNSICKEGTFEACPTETPICQVADDVASCVAESPTPSCGDGKIEGTEACDTGAELTPATPAFPENATCTSAMNDGKTYEGELACSADCSAIVTTGCTAAVPPVSCTAGACRLSTSGETTVTEICNAEGNAWTVDSCPSGTTCEVAENATEGTCTSTEPTTWDYTEDFETFPWGTSYGTQTFTNQGIQWDVVSGSIQTDANYKLNGNKSITIRGKDNVAGALTASNIPAGVGILYFKYRAADKVAFTVSCGDYSYSSGAIEKANTTTHTFEQTVNNAATSCTIAIDNEAVSSGNRRLVIDDVSCTSYTAQ